MINNGSKIKYIVSGVFLFLMSLGLSASFFLSQQSQDIRQQAMEEEGGGGAYPVTTVTPTPTPSPEPDLEDGVINFETFQMCRNFCEDGTCEGSRCIPNQPDAELEDEDDLEDDGGKKGDRCSAGSCGNGLACATSPFGNFCVAKEDAGDAELNDNEEDIGDTEIVEEEEPECTDSWCRTNEESEALSEKYEEENYVPLDFLVDDGTASYYENTEAILEYLAGDNGITLDFLVDDGTASYYENGEDIRSYISGYNNDLLLKFLVDDRTASYYENTEFIGNYLDVSSSLIYENPFLKSSKK